ncbi:MAG: glycosyltransferase family 4 protein [Candidatus Paceibacterota bacterium]|jgi:glycosyltransferase involved in cell wall biosynthesis|nr:glycosyltransferase family 4 protein [Candidatus Paceibacterota bacterium]
MKIIFIFDFLAPNDARKYLVDEIMFLRSQSIDARVVTLGKEDMSNTLYSDALFSRETFACVPIPKLWKFSDWKKLKKYLEDEHPDLIITCDAKADVVARIAARLSRIPMKVFVFAHNVSDIAKRTKFYDDVLSHVTDYYIVTSEVAKIALSKMEVSPKKIAVLPDGISLEKYGLPPSRDIRAEYGIAPDEFVFIFLGDLIPSKNVPVLLRAMEKIPVGRLLIVGDGREKAALKELSSSLGLSDRVIFEDSTLDVANLLMVSNAMVLPSKTDERLPLSVILGLYSGLPVITTELPGISELVKDRENGLIVRQQDSVELSRAMVELMTNGELYAKLKANAPKDLEKYSVSAHAVKLLTLFQEKQQSTNK